LDILHTSALTSLEEGRALPRGEALERIQRIWVKIDEVREQRDREGLEERLRQVYNLVSMEEGQ
jgi:hypothetical protein